MGGEGLVHPDVGVRWAWLVHQVTVGGLAWGLSSFRSAWVGKGAVHVAKLLGLKSIRQGLSSIQKPRVGRVFGIGWLGVEWYGISWFGIGWFGIGWFSY